MAYISDKHYRTTNAVHEYDSFDPLLVQLHDSVIQYKSKNKNQDSSSELINSVAAILDANLTDSEKALASDVLIGLIQQVERDIRINLSQKLAPRDDLHHSLLNYMAYGTIDIAGPVLEYSPLLTDTDILYIIEATSPNHWRAIANRDCLSERVSETLINKGDAKAIHNLLLNESILLEDNLLKMIGVIAPQNEDLAKDYIGYKSLPKDLAVSIYWQVSVAIREKITQQFKVTGEEVDTALEDSVQDFTDTILSSDNMRPSNLMVEIASQYHASGRIKDRLLVDCLRRRQGRFFIALFAKHTDLSFDVVWSMMKQVGGQALAVACRAKNISKENFVSLFLLTRTIARSSQAVTAEELKMAMRYYDGLTFKAAQDILKDSIAQ